MLQKIEVQTSAVQRTVYTSKNLEKIGSQAIIIKIYRAIEEAWRVPLNIKNLKKKKLNNRDIFDGILEDLY